MLARFVPAFLLVLCLPALAADKGPVMGDLMKQQGYRYAWEGMVAGETPPAWVTDYAKTLDGPPTPTIPVPLDGETYTLGFTCKANECETNQLYVLFAPEARDAWAMLVTVDGVSWVGRPDERIQTAIKGALRR